ncbi:MAG: acetyl-CoA carboxylase biotin carboxyl carrier protein [Bacillota bacterium]|nr:acetyl-CoA carboxylase biotin carboxyl carrier protein [Bacillota bacterium]
MDFSFVQDIMKNFNSMNIQNLELETNEFKLKLQKQDVVQNYTVESKNSSLPCSVKPQETEDLISVTSPIVGTFYSAPSPDVEPFISVGDTVKKGSRLCIIEAMKLMNEIEAEQDGIVTEICIQNGEMVEFGEVLIRLKPLSK